MRGVLFSNIIIITLLAMMTLSSLALESLGRRRCAVKVAYDGTNFAGWQFQPNRRTVQGTLEKALTRRFDGNRISTLGASRTDAGVHAKGQVMQADMPLEDPLGEGPLLRRQLNRMLPPDVRILDLTPAPDPEPWQADKGLPWHVIVNSIGKRYVYKLSASPEPMDPSRRLYRARVADYALDFQKLSDALELFVGEHDFRSFSNNAKSDKDGKVKSDDERSTVRTVHAIDFLDEGRGDATITLELDGALYKMVRNIVGTSLAIAGVKHRRQRRNGKLLTLDDIPDLLQGTLVRNDNPAMSAPAHGLTLDEVYFKGDTFPTKPPGFFAATTTTTTTATRRRREEDNTAVHTCK
mmetsp:Transcript_21201/g.68404  ORF Transcript_21201/g.68404 Transcript_21201/m.68404 type:complete len:352 (-) Transcript_21201:63-1118(-)